MLDSSQLDNIEEALGVSVSRLHRVVRTLGDAELETSAYPSDWSVADVLSHLGSSAEISLRRLDDSFAGRATPDDYPSSVWDRWNAKPSAVQARDFLIQDQAFTDRLASLTPDERSASIDLGPLTLDIGGYVGLRLNEHVLHTWDVEVAFDRAARLSSETVAPVVDNLDLIGRFTAKPTGDHRIITVLTSAPARGFIVELTREAATFAVTDAPAVADVTLAAEAFIRLVYGRLDPDHSDEVDGDPVALNQLRRAFPGP